MRRTAMLTTALAVVAAALLYLRDPPWLVDYTTGMRGWQRAEDGAAFRWAGSHASFFVPADAGHVLIPVSTTFTDGDNQPMVVTITVDDERAARVLLQDARWTDVTLTLPPKGNRRVRRVDVRTSRTRADYHGVRIREIKVSHDGADWRPCCFRPDEAWSRR